MVEQREKTTKLEVPPNNTICISSMNGKYDQYFFVLEFFSVDGRRRDMAILRGGRSTKESERDRENG